MLIQHLQPAAAGKQQTARAACGLGPECLGEPATGAGQRRTASATLGGRDEMALGFAAAAQVQCYPAGQQMRLSGIAGVECIQPGGSLCGVPQQPHRSWPGRVTCLAHHQPGARQAPGILL